MVWCLLLHKMTGGEVTMSFMCVKSHINDMSCELDPFLHQQNSYERQ